VTSSRAVRVFFLWASRGLKGDIMTQSVDLTERQPWYQGLTGYHYLVLAVACFGWSFDTMDQWLYVFVKQHALRDLLPLTVPNSEVSTYIGYAQTCLILGWATGGLIFGMVGDRLGRTRTMALTILVYALFTGLSGLSQNWWQFALFRFLTGLGVGGEFAAGAALVAESFPAHARSTALSVVQASSTLGNVAAGVINLIMTSYLPVEQAWRWVFAIGILPALLVVVIFAFVREPEAWQAARARAREAKAKGERRQVGSIVALFTEPTVRRNTLVGVALAAVGVIGFWGISTWTPELLRATLSAQNLDPGLIERRVSYAGMLQNFGGMFGALAFGWLARRIGRRPAFLIALLGCAVEIPATFFFANTYHMALVFFFGMGFVLLLLLGGFTVYFPELFPTRLRATGTGFCYNVARYLSAPSPAFFGQLSAAIGIQKAALAISSAFVLGIAVLPFAPETKGKPLPE